MPFQSTRAKSHLLIQTKRPLSPPSGSTITSNTQPSLVIRSLAERSAASSEHESGVQARRRIEVDFSAAPQPFLDPALWERIMLAAGAGEDEEGRAEREKEYGGMAVKRRVGGRIR